MRKQKMINVAIAYDFDGTLAKGNIQENSFLPSIGIDKIKFWNKVKEYAKNNEMDEILSYMYLMIEESKKSDSVKIDKNNIKKHGKSVRYFNGVESFFDAINDYAKSKNIKLEHYIISSGTREMIQGTTISKHFEHIYASSYLYDKHGIPIWPALAINYTTKTQFLFRINKGTRKVWDNSTINKNIPSENRPIPFNRMIYIGDGDTDIPAMKMINHQGGFSIAVYPPNTKGAKQKAKELIQNKRATYVAEADYEPTKSIFTILKAILDHISAMHILEKFKKI